MAAERASSSTTNEVPSKGTIAAFRAHLNRWEKRRDAAKTDYHRAVAEAEIDWYKVVIEALLNGRELPARPEKSARATAWLVYRHFDADGVLLYVGTSTDWLRRTEEHRREAPWFAEVANITIQRFPTAEEMTSAEKEAVAEEKPLYNLVLQQPSFREKFPLLWQMSKLSQT